MKLECALYIVATPIGNLGDMTIRAQEILRGADVVAAEDTRHSARLMQHFAIDTPMQAYHDHSNEQQIDKLLSRLADGQSVALISDAGTPLISDPGYRLVALARARDIKVVPVPGACAVIAALSASGLASDRFTFEGFLPAKAVARLGCLQALAKEPRTLIFYESPHRIRDSLSAFLDAFGADRQLVLAREITKTYETFLCGSVVDVIAKVDADDNQLKGEMVLIVAGFESPNVEDISAESERIMALLLAELPIKKAAALTAQITGDKKNKLYQWALER